MHAPATPVERRFAPTALMLGNFVTGCSVIAPAGMLGELSEGLGVSISYAGLLITFGAIVLCIGSPLTAWLTSRIERRTLLISTLAVFAITNAASAFAPDYAALLVIRLLMLGIGALYTPQAAGTAGLIVPLEKRGSTIAYIFLGWSLAAAVGLPLITLIASRYGFRAAYGSIGVVACLSFALLAWRLPRGLLGEPVDLKTWGQVGRNRMILLLLLITTLQMSGQFVVFTFMGPLLVKLTGASPDAVGLVFALYGVFGFIGIAIATRIVDSWGPYKTSVLFTVLMLTGVSGWAFSAGAGRLRRVERADREHDQANDEQAGEVGRECRCPVGECHHRERAGEQRAALDPAGQPRRQRRADAEHRGAEGDQQSGGADGDAEVR